MEGLCGEVVQDGVRASEYLIHLTFRWLLSNNSGMLMHSLMLWCVC